MAAPHPTGRAGLIRIPAPAATAVAIRFALLDDRDVFDPPSWRREALAASASFNGWWECDLDAFGLLDGFRSRLFKPAFGR